MAATTVTIGATTYTANQRAAGGWVGIDALTLTVDEYSTLDFTVYGCGPNPPYLAGSQVAVQIDQGSGLTTVFQGNISEYPISHQSKSGWNYGYHCADLKQRGDWVTIQSPQGFPTCEYNLDQDDEDYNPTFAGLQVGQIVARTLQVYNTATNLYTYGVGGYTFGSGPPPFATLAAQTLVDLSYLTFVPQSAVRHEGGQILTVMEQFVRDYYPQVSSYVDANGIIRFVFPLAWTTTYNIKVPGGTVTSPDLVDLPDYTPKTDQCFTQWQIIGQDCETAVLDVLNGTLTPYNDSTDRSNWNINYHLYPSGSCVYGNVTIDSSTSATVTCDDPTAAWIANFWLANGGCIMLVNTAVSGLPTQAQRFITANGALTAGGSCTVQWSSDLPLDYGTYNRFILVGQNNPLAYVDRLFWITEPDTGATGLNTFIGANLINRNPNGIYWANNDQPGGPTYYAAAKILWSINGDNANPDLRWPIQELPVDVKVLPATGQIQLADPACFIAALAAGTEDALQLGYPTTALGGLWYNIVVAVPYTRGPLVAQYPASGFAGSAYTDYGIARAWQEFSAAYTSREQNSQMVALATAKAYSVQDAVIEGRIMYHGLPTAFNAFSLGYFLNIEMPATSPLDSRPVSVRTVVVKWPNDGPNIYEVTFVFSNKKAPFSGDSGWVHPNFTRLPESDFLNSGAIVEGANSGR